MSVRHLSSARPRGRRAAATLAGLLVLSVAAAGCSANAQQDTRTAGSNAPSTPASSAPPQPVARFSDNLPKTVGTSVHVDKVVQLKVAKGRFDKVTVRAGKANKVTGKVSDGGTTWTSTSPLEPGLTYHVEAVATDDQGLRTVEKRRFRTDNLTLDQQTYPSIAPLPGETVGVGMPIIVHFDVPVTDKASIEKHLSVQTSPHQEGAWRWISDNEVHWRPKNFWKPGTDVTVKANVDSVSAGNGIYGQVNNQATFHIGDSIISKVNVQTHEMKVYINGALARTMPISAGKPGFITRSGIKVIIEKTKDMIMDSRTVGIPKSSPDFYRLHVKYDMRVTYSGEFLHAAPWSDSEHGIANVSHGCVGMSTPDAEWLYNMTKRGDVVEVTGSDRHMTLTNGYGDWNLPFSQYKAGSALN